MTVLAMSLRARLVSAFVLVVLVLGVVGGVAIWGSVKQGSAAQRLRAANDTAALALNTKFQAADMNGDQTAYGYDVVRALPGAASANAPNRAAFVASRARLTALLAALGQRPLSAPGRQELTAAHAAFARFAALDRTAWALVQQQRPGAATEMSRLILGPELTVYRRLADDLSRLAASEQHRAHDAAASVRSTKRVVLDVMVVMLVAAFGLAGLIAVLVTRSLIDRVRRLRAAERELRESEAELLRAQEFGRVGSWIWYAREQRNTWSPEALRIYGFGDEAATHDPELFFSRVHPDDREWIRQEAEQAFREGRASEAEFRIVRPDGGIRWLREQSAVELEADGTPARTVGVVMDITEAKEAEQKLRLSEERLQRVLEASQLGVLVIDPEAGAIEFANPTFCQISGYALEELVGKNPTTLMLAGQSPVLRSPAWPKLLSGELPSFRTTATMVRRDGERREVDIVALVVPGADRRPRLVGTIADKTELMRADEQLRQQQRLDALGQLAGGVAHDFNNLLTVIIGHATLALAAGADNADPNLEEIAAAGERAKQLVHQLLTFARQEQAEVDVLELNTVVEGTQRLLRRLIETNIELTTELSPEPLRVQADLGQLEQVLINLAVNARDAMPSGGRLTIRTVRGDGEAVVSVEDTGEGMDLETQRRIFEPFFTTKEVGEGTGLGLATVYGIVEKAGGGIQVDSQPGQGAKFTITLPLTAGVTEPAATEHEGPRPTHEIAVGVRVLLVDDDPAVRRVSEKLLQRIGCAVVCVSDPLDVFNVAERQGPFDVLVTDLMMPSITGTELAGRLRERHPGLPVLFISGYAEEILSETREPGTAYVAKPFTGTALQEAISTLLAGAAPETAGARPA